AGWKVCSLVFSSKGEPRGTQHCGRVKRGGEVELGLAQSDHHGEDTSDDENDAHGRRQFLAAFGLDANLGIADLYIVVLAMRNRHDKRQKSEYQQQGADNGSVLHIEPRLRESRFIKAVFVERRNRGL